MKQKDLFVDESEDIPSSFDQLIQQELTKFDAVVPAVNELAKEFMPLQIQSLEDKDGYVEVSKALRFIVSKRTAVEDKRRELKADSLSYGRAVDARAKEITAMLEPIESHLKNEKSRIDAEVERLKIEEEERKQKFIKDRINVLIGLNMFQYMTEFVWTSKLNPTEQEKFLCIDLELFSDEDFSTFVDKIKTRIDIETNIITEREEKAKAELEVIERERKNIQQEMKEMREQRAVERNTHLTELGLVCNNDCWVYFYKAAPRPTEFLYSTVTVDEVYLLSKSHWDVLFEEIKIKIAEIKSQDDAAFAVIEANKVLVEDSVQSEAKFVESNEIIDKMSDQEAYLHYVSQLKAVSPPELETKKFQSYINTIVKSIDTFYNIK